MTISSPQTRENFEGNGSTNEFVIPFMFLRDDDIEVYLSTDDTEELLTISTDYQLSGAGNHSGGSCTMTTTPEAGQTVTIRRNPELVQEIDYKENEAFPAATHEAALDNLTMICQALSERLDRTITLRISSAITGVEVPAPEPNRLLSWNTAGDDLVNCDAASFDMAPLPVPIHLGGTAAETATDALTNLGFGTTGQALAATDTYEEAQAVMDAEPADVAILKRDINDLLQAAYGDEAQVHTGTDLSTLTVSRNHIAWTLTADSQFSDVTLPYDGTYVFHVYPDGHALALAETYKSDGSLPYPSILSGEIRVTVEQYGGRKTIVSLQNMEA